MNKNREHNAGSQPYQAADSQQKPDRDGNSTTHGSAQQAQRPKKPADTTAQNPQQHAPAQPAKAGEKPGAQAQKRT
jgi:hypothetical protein